MGRSAYWKASYNSLASSSLGDANRGAFLALQSAVSTRRRPVATDPPERRASSCRTSLEREGLLLGASSCDGLLPVLSAADEGRCYRGSRFGPAGLACIAPGLLRGCGTRRGDGGAGALPLRCAGLRPQADRPQRPRRA